jgi:hypothetical protein
VIHGGRRVERTWHVRGHVAKIRNDGGRPLTTLLYGCILFAIQTSWLGPGCPPVPRLSRGGRLLESAMLAVTPTRLVGISLICSPGVCSSVDVGAYRGILVLHTCAKKRSWPQGVNLRPLISGRTIPSTGRSVMDCLSIHSVFRGTFPCRYSLRFFRAESLRGFQPQDSACGAGGFMNRGG